MIFLVDGHDDSEVLQILKRHLKADATTQLEWNDYATFCQF
jgi:hypothetical protein